MATFTLTNFATMADAYQLTTYLRENSLAVNCEAVDDTAWTADTRTYKGGLFNFQLTGAGLKNDTDNVDGIYQLLLGGGYPLSVGPNGLAAGARCYCAEGAVFEYTPAQGSVGDIASFAFSATATSKRWGRGLVLAALQTVSTTGAAAGQQVGAVASGSSAYSFLHVTGQSGTATIDATIESDADGNFAAGQTTRITHTQFAAPGSEIGEVAGAITDAYWRTVYTIGGTGTISFFNALVIR